MHIPEDTPYALRDVLSSIAKERAKQWELQVKILGPALERAQVHIQFLQRHPDKLAVVKPLRSAVAQANVLQRALAQLQSGSAVHEAETKAVMLVSRFRTADAAARRKRLEELAAHQNSPTRFVPTAPVYAMPGTLPVGTQQDGLARQFIREVEVELGHAPRPVQLSAFDMCPKCQVALQYNQTLQQLVCPTPDCGHWKRFADMTSSALPFGEDVHYLRHAYRAVTHLDDTMKFAEATETHVVSTEALVRVMERLWASGIQDIADITIPRVRVACKEAKVKMENSVQIYCRLTGTVPQRMTPFMKDQMRIMFNAAEAPFRRHAAGRTNHLSFPFTLRKYCELLGYWEMLDSLPMLRGPQNIAVHDAITSRVFNDLGWSFCCSVYKVAPTIAAKCGPGHVPASVIAAVRAEEAARAKAKAAMEAAVPDVAIDPVEAQRQFQRKLAGVTGVDAGTGPAAIPTS